MPEIDELPPSIVRSIFDREFDDDSTTKANRNQANSPKINEYRISCATRDDLICHLQDGDTHDRCRYRRIQDDWLSVVNSSPGDLTLVASVKPQVVSSLSGLNRRMKPVVIQTEPDKVDVVALKGRDDPRSRCCVRAGKMSPPLSVDFPSGTSRLQTSNLQKQSSVSHSPHHRSLLLLLLVLCIHTVTVSAFDLGFLFPWGQSRGSGDSDTPPTIAPLNDKDARLSRGVDRMSNWASPGGVYRFWDRLAGWFDWPWDRGFDRLNREPNVEWRLDDLDDFNFSGVRGNLMSFGDFQSNKHADLFYLSEWNSRPAVSVYLWDSHTNKFAPPIYFQLPNHMSAPQSIVTSDINLDGRLDIFVIYQTPAHKFGCGAFIQNRTDSDVPFKSIWDSMTTSGSGGVTAKVQPFVADINFDGFPDLVVEVDKAGPGGVGRGVWLNRGGVDFEFVYWGEKELAKYLFWEDEALRGKSRLSPTLLSLSSPHSSAVVDVNGDCVPDLVLDVVDTAGLRKLEFWLAMLKVDDMADDESSTVLQPVYSRSSPHTLELPSGTQQLTFGDVDGDGTLDVVVAVCGKGMSRGVCLGGDEIVTYVNIQPGLCRESVLESALPRPPGPCRSTAALCVASQFQWATLSPYRQSFISSLEEGAEAATKSRGSDAAAGGRSSANSIAGLLEVFDKEFWDRTINRSPLDLPKSTEEHHFVGSDRYPTTPRLGDFDSDGYPDVLVTVAAESGVRALLLRNLFGRYRRHDESALEFYNLSSADIYTDNKSLNSSAPIFVPQTALAFPSIKLEVAAFFDISEDGSLDIIGCGLPSDEWWPKASLTAAYIQQAKTADHLFLKVSGQTGACSGSGCPSTDKSDSDSTQTLRPYGSLAHGGAVKIAGTNLDGRAFSRAASQLPQSAYSPLGLPFCLLGLDRSNNYVDYFFYGISFPGTKRSLEDLSKSSKGVKVEFGSGALEVKESLVGDSMYTSSHFRRWNSLIPNSHVIVAPHPRPTPSRWTLELSVSPSKKFFAILAATLVSLLSIGVAICVLDRREKVEDFKEHQGFRKHFIAI